MGPTIKKSKLKIQTNSQTIEMTKIGEKDMKQNEEIFYLENISEIQEWNKQDMNRRFNQVKNAFASLRNAWALSILLMKQN